MRNTRIWESASRPLFVRTVWLEGSELRRGLQRHFLWDYDTRRRPLERLNTTNESLELEKITELNDFDALNVAEEAEEAFQIGSAKVKLHEPNKLPATKKCKTVKHRRRPSIFSQRYKSYDSFHLDCCKDISGRNSDISNSHTPQNPLTPTATLADAAEELLAERVLHWLDLAGKAEFIKSLNELKEMEVKLSKTCKLRQDSIKRHHNKIQNTPKSKTCKTRNLPRSTTASTQNDKPVEAVKHITIIFNKEGQPIRFNRPAKNIDLCALSASPATTRRLAGTLASARLYKSAENSRCLNTPKTPYTKPNKSLTASRHLDMVADLTNSNKQKRLPENSAASGYNNNLLDAKKELHIFMPTLPKKGLNSSAYGTEDGISELSQNFNEMCKI